MSRLLHWFFDDLQAPTPDAAVIRIRSVAGATSKMMNIKISVGT